jgi:CRISPR-associated endoribonuclease Cas6
VGARVYVVTATMVADRRFVIRTWSGSFALRLLYDVLGARGQGGGFMAEPVRVNGRPALTGLYAGPLSSPRPRPGCRLAVERGARLDFTYRFTSEELVRAFVESLGECPAVEEPTCRLELASLSIEQRELPAPAERGGELELARVRFATPTAFMFYGRDVLYPSPTRLMLSALKNYSAATGADTTRAAEGLAKTVEAVGTPRARRVLVDIGEHRLVPAFLGEATIAIHASRDAPLLLAALRAAEVLGVGVSRTLGFGMVKLLAAGGSPPEPAPAAEPGEVEE